MNPQELQDWITRHGELAVPPQRAMTGQMIYITNDGSRVVLTQLTPDSYKIDDITEKDASGNVTATAPPNPDASPTSAPSEPAPTTPAQSAPAAGRGGAMAISKADLEAKAGGNPNLTYQGQKVIDKQVTEYGVTKTIRVPVVTWIDKRTGYTLSAEVEPGGDSYTVVQDGIDERNKDDKSENTGPPGGKAFIDEDGPQGRRMGWNPATKAYDRDLGSSPQAQAAAAGQSGEQRVPVDGRPGWTKITRKKVQGGETTETVTFVGPDNKEVGTLPEKPAESKTTLSTINGQPGYRTVVTPQGAGQPDKVEHFGPDGKPLAQLPAEAATKKEPVPNKPGIVKVTKGEGANLETYYEDEKGNRVPTPIDDKSGFGVEPEGAPEMTYTAGQLSAGLRTYSSWLSQQVKLYHDSGGKQGVKPDEATKLMERRVALAEAALKEQEGLGNAQKGLLDNATTQRGQSLSETQSRRGTAERIVTNSQSNILPLVRYAGRGGGGLAVDAMNAALDRGRQYVDSFGGFKESPEVNPDSFPALAQLRQSAMAGIQTAAQGGPQIFDPRNPPTAPGAPAAPPVTGTPVPAATNPVSNTPVLLPPSRPSTPAPPPVAPPADAQAAANAGPVPGQDPTVWTPPPANAQAAANAGPVPGQDAGTWQPPAAPGAPDYGQPGMSVLPQQTSQIGAVPVDAAAAGGGVMKTMSPRFMQEQRYGPGNFFDPEQRGAELMARLGIDPSIMKQAIGSMYG